MTDYRSLENKIRDLWISEANRNTEMRRKVANVGRPTDNVKDETSKLAKQGEIKTKIIDEAADGDIGKVAADKKKPKDKDDSDKSSDKAAKKDTDMDDMDAKAIKGGKTEVITDPKTDDSTENSTDEDQKSKKAKNQANKEIGAKGVKEETMLRSDKNHGSSQSLINAIMEALKGGQKKIDANHNGKIDAQDFKILKGKKKVEEEVETIDEGNPDNKEKKNAAATAVGSKNRDDQHLGSRGMKTSVADKIRGRQIQKEEVETLDEISKKFAARYNNKAQREVNRNEPSDPDKLRQRKNREAGVKTSFNKYHGYKVKVPATEETDPGFSEAEIARIEEIAKGL